jgi:hypothetical protein
MEPTGARDLIDLERGQRPTWISEHLPDDIATALFRFSVRLPNNEQLNVDLATTIDFDYETLEEDLVKTPHQYVFWSAVYSEAKSMVALIERAIKIRRGVITEAVLESAREAGVKLTEKVVLGVIEKDEKLVVLDRHLIKAQKTAGKLWHMTQALQMKFEAIRSLAGFKRQEQQRTQ